jgi:methyl coenzyme M reductase subunit D
MELNAKIINAITYEFSVPGIDGDTIVKIVDDEEYGESIRLIYAKGDFKIPVREYKFLSKLEITLTDYLDFINQDDIFDNLYGGMVELFSNILKNIGTMSEDLELYLKLQ